jgi:hypothetical protein
MMDSTDVVRRGAVQIDETIDVIELYYAQGWTDGLPVVPPTRAKVQAKVERSGRGQRGHCGTAVARRQSDRGTHCHERRDGRVLAGVYASYPDGS